MDNFNKNLNEELENDAAIDEKNLEAADNAEDIEANDVPVVEGDSYIPFPEETESDEPVAHVVEINVGSDEENDELESDDSVDTEDVPNFNQPIYRYVPDYSFSEPRPQKVKNKGLKVFALLLAAILVIALSVSAGYFAAVYSGAASGNGAVVNVPKLELENRPDSDKEIFDTFSEAFSNVNESVVSIMVYSPNGSSASGSASGVIYSKDGYIVTNDHIYESVPKAKFMVRLYNGKEYKASFVAGDTRSDLAVIKIDEKVSGLKPARFGNSDDVLVGEQVITVGYPSSYGDSATLTHGIISAVDRRVTSTTTSYASSFLQTDAVINPGNSGGALANMYGQVIGITSSKLAGDAYDAVSYAIPTVTMKRVVSSLIKDGCVSDRAKLGITYTEVNTLAAEANKLPVGILIGSISSDSDLSGKGFNEGDVITEVNGVAITSSEVLLKAIENSKAGDKLELTIYKTESKRTKTVEVKLLADKGSSSYTTKESAQSQESFGDIFGGGENNDGEGDGEDSGSSKPFDFPLD